MLRMVNLLIALSFGVHLEQLEHLIGLTCPRPFLLRPLCNSISPIFHYQFERLLCEVRSSPEGYSYFAARFLTMLGDSNLFDQ